MDTHALYLLEKIAGIRGAMNILPPKSLGDKGIQSVLQDLAKRKKISKPQIPGPDEVLDRAAGYLADKGMLRKNSAEKLARCWEGFEPVPGKKAYSEGSCRPKTQTTKRVNEKVAYLKSKLANLMSGAVPKGGMASALQTAKGSLGVTGDVSPRSAMRGGMGGGGMGGGGMRNPGATGIARAVGMGGGANGMAANKINQFKGMGGGGGGGMRSAIGKGIRGAGMGKRSEEIPLEELTRALNKLSSLKKKSQVIKEAAGTVTVYYASPERQLVRIPKDAVVSLNEDLAYQMGRFYPETKETWSDKDVSGKWNGGTPQPTFRAGRMPTGRPTLYKAQVNETDLAVISNMVKSVKKLRRSVNAAAVKQNIEK
jgi:hypothetical protein